MVRFSYKLSQVGGAVHSGGNVVFGPDGNTLYSVVNNRVTVFDLVGHVTKVLPYEHTSPIRRLAVSPDGRFLLSVDQGGHLLLVNLDRGVVLARLRLKRTRRVRDLQFSPSGQYFAITQERQLQVWRTPGRKREFAPFVLHRTYGSHHDDITCIHWSDDGEYLATGSKDMTVRLWTASPREGFVPPTLSGHRDQVMAVFWVKGGRRLYSLAKDGFIYTWGPKEEEGAEKGEGGGESGTLVSGGDGGDPMQSGWRYVDRQCFKRDRNAALSCAQYHRDSGMLVVGFSNGIFGLYEMPDCSVVHTLSVSHVGIGTVAINRTGEWLAFGCSTLGQLLVWEWQSESYVLKQQGHGYGLNTLAFSSTGQVIVTGGDDNKVKLWNASSGFCFVTFSEHTAPVTAVCFLSSGQAILSASLDGTVRAHDLIRYKNFRTLSTPQPAQLVSLTVDPSGEVVCAGSLEPFEIYVWSLQTGKILDVLAGHGGPVSCLDFNPTEPMLASGSWDGTVKLWNVYNNELIETLYHNSDVLAVAFRPDGRQLCVSTLSGTLHFWDPIDGRNEGVIEGKLDISGGRKTSDKVTAKSSAATKHFTSLCYTADGTCMLAGGRSKYVCIYEVKHRMLVKKFQVSHDRTLDGVLDELPSYRLTEAGSLDLLNVSGESDDDRDTADYNLPGAKRGPDGSKRTTRPEVRTNCVRFSPTGREWAAASPEGLLLYCLEEDMIFDPMDLDETVTPAAIKDRTSKGEHSRALVMSVQLNQEEDMTAAIDAVPFDNIVLVARSVPPACAPRLLQLLVKRLPRSPHLEYHLQWCLCLLQMHGPMMMKDSARNLSTFRALQKSILDAHEDLGRLLDENQYALDLIRSAGASEEKREEDQMEVVEELVV